MPQKNYSAQEMQDWWNQYVQDQARQAAAAGPTLVDQFHDAYMRSLGAAFNANLSMDLGGPNWGSGMYRSTNPDLAGREVSGITGTLVSPRVNAPATAIANTVTTPAVTSSPVVASNSAAKTPQFITPYSTLVTGPGAYGESDVNPFRKTKTWI